jgi:ferredoxin
MPLTARGRRIAGELAGAVGSAASGAASPPLAAVAISAGVLGCEIVRHDELCVGCARCVVACPAGALTQESWFDPALLLQAPRETRRGALGEALRRIAHHAPVGPVPVPERVRTFRAIAFAPERCLGCGACVRACPTGALRAQPVRMGAVAGPPPAGGVCAPVPDGTLPAWVRGGTVLVPGDPISMPVAGAVEGGR